MKLLTLLLSAVLFVGQSFAAEIHPWVSASVLWGQGGIGAVIVTTNYTITASDAFVWDWGNQNVSYNETDINVSIKNNVYGSRFKIQNHNEELAPFVGHKSKWLENDSVVLRNYNEMEYRNNPYGFDDDYFRGQIYLRLEYKLGVLGEKAIRPYIANSYFFDASGMDFEKDRIYIGYLVQLEKIGFGFYVIPYVFGKTGGEWDDNKPFGAFMNFLL